MAGTHALLSPSAAHRWSLCPASISAARAEPNATSIDAASGTLTHQMGQEYLLVKDSQQAWDLWARYAIGSVHTVEGYEFTIDQERCDRVKAYGDAVLREPHQHLLVEQHLDMSELLGVPDQGGTADAVTLDDIERMITVHDLKDGAGIVHARDNKQLLMYARAALHAYSMIGDWIKVKVAIHQPRMDHYDEWTYTKQELIAEFEKLKAPAALAFALYNSAVDKAPEYMVPGETQCRWCPIRAKCPARTESVLDMFPDKIEEPAVHMLDNIEVAEALKRVPEIESWCRDIRSESLKRALAGAVLPGFKMVRGKRSARAWIDEDEAVRMLELQLPKEDCYQPRKPISPTVAEKALKKAGGSLEGFSNLVTQSDGSLSIVPDTDDRPAVVTAEVSFEP